MMRSKIKYKYDKRKLTRLCTRRKVKELALFGSVLSDDFRPDSDIDVLISFREDASHSLLDWLDTIDELRVLFGRTVDPVTTHGLRKYQQRKEILKTRQVIYAA